MNTQTVTTRHQAKNVSHAVMMITFLSGIFMGALDHGIVTRYFTKRHTLILLMASAVSGFVMATSANFLPLFGETMLGLAKGSAGYLVAPFAISSMIASLVGGILVDKMGAKRVLQFGFLISLLGAVQSCRSSAS